MSSDHSASGREMRFESFKIQYIREIETHRVAEFADSLGGDFYSVCLEKHNFRVGAGGIGTTDAAVLLVVAMFAGGFFGELGREAYQGVKGALFRLYGSLRRMITESGGFQPLAVELVDDEHIIRFVFTEGLDETLFTAALTSIPMVAQKAVDDLAADPPEIVIEGGSVIEFTYDLVSRKWRRSF